MIALDSTMTEARLREQRWVQARMNEIGWQLEIPPGGAARRRRWHHRSLVAAAGTQFRRLIGLRRWLPGPRGERVVVTGGKARTCLDACGTWAECAPRSARGTAAPG